MIFSDFLALFAALSWLSGRSTGESIKAKKAKFLEITDEDFALTQAFMDRNHYEISRRLGRPYRHKFPEFLAAPYEREYKYSDLRKAEDQWLARSMAGIMEYVAKKEGWVYSRTIFSAINVSPLIVLKEQETYMKWYEDARTKFPHYAVDQIYIEDYPRMWTYFAEIQKRSNNLGDLTGPLGIPPESSNTKYDGIIRDHFYSIDPENKLGGADVKYMIYSYAKPFDYHGDNWNNISKLYTALNRIIRAEGFDPYDIFKKSKPFSNVTKDKVRDMYRARRKQVKDVNDIIRTIRNDSRSNYECEIHMEALRFMLRLDGHNPIFFGL